MKAIIKSQYHSTVESVIDECRTALLRIDADQVESFIEAINAADKIFFLGVGRVMLALQAIAKRFAHLGYHTFFVGQITEPAITDKDILIIGSGSGESLIPVNIAIKAKNLGAKIIYIGSNHESTIASLADLMVRIPVRTKLGLSDEIPSAQPMTSLFEQSLLLFGDAVAKLIVEDKGIDIEKLWNYHANLE